MMEIVIKITDDLYERASRPYNRLDGYGASQIWALIRNGIVLPKGHGRLIDADMVVEDIDTERVNLFMDGLKGTPRVREHLNDLRRIMDEIPTIIEADKEATDGSSD